MAPEVFTGKYDQKCDVWSLGCTLYFTIFGKLPFQADNLVDLRDLILKGDFEMPEGISMNLRDFIASMIEVNVEKRITIEEALNHPWVRMGMDTSEEYQMSKKEINSEIIESLTRYKSQSLLKKAAMNVLVKHLNGR